MIAEICPSLKTDVQNCLANSTVNDKCPHNTNRAMRKMTSPIMIIFLDLMKDKLCQRSVTNILFLKYFVI